MSVERKQRNLLVMKTLQYPFKDDSPQVRRVAQMYLDHHKKVERKPRSINPKVVGPYIPAKKIDVGKLRRNKQRNDTRLSEERKKFRRQQRLEDPEYIKRREEKVAKKKERLEKNMPAPKKMF